MINRFTRGGNPLEISIEELRQGFDREKFIISDANLNTVFLALRLGKPLLVEGPPGVGKTRLAKVLSRIVGARLIRLQCHIGLEESNALYDWNIQRQLVQIYLTAGGQVREEDLFSFSNLLQRPLLQAITSKEQVVLLVDEIDHADLSFEAYLLELLSDFQVSIPEIGTISAACRPVVVITSNGERELSEAARRRCVFLYLDFPTIEQEAEILRQQAPEALEKITEDLSLTVAWVRDRGYTLGESAPVAMDWARALMLLNSDHYRKDYLDKTLESLAKNRDNIAGLLDAGESHE